MNCLICDSKTQLTLKFPNYPISRPPVEIKEVEFPNKDLNFYFCSTCGHGQILDPIHPESLYKENEYIYSSKTSISANKNILNFSNYLSNLFKTLKNNGATPLHILEFGTNDLTLANILQLPFETYHAIDPTISLNQRSETKKNIIPIATIVENLTSDSFTQKPNLIICQHTFEHILNPKLVLAHLKKICAQNTLFVFELPFFDTLFLFQRFDQIFHHHPQYFTWQSFFYLLKLLDFELIDVVTNRHWGSLIVSFSNNKPSNELILKKPIPDLDINHKSILDNYASFKSWCQQITEKLKKLSLDTPLYGYGASTTLPLYAYHMENDLSFLTKIYDDNSSRSGYFLDGIAPQISTTPDDLANDTLVITAIDNAIRIINKLSQNQTKQLINLHWSY